MRSSLVSVYKQLLATKPKDIFQGARGLHRLRDKTFRRKHGEQWRSVMQEETSAIVDLIKINWQDIHHSRNQDWKFWVILAGIVAALGGLSTEPVANRFTICCLLAAGCATSAVASLISWNHRDLLCKKTAHIEWLETLLAQDIGPRARRGLPYQERFKDEFADRWSVSGIIFSFYVTIAASFLLGLSLIALSDTAQWIKAPLTGTLALDMLIFGLLVFFAAYFASGMIMSKSRKKYREHFGKDLTESFGKVFVAGTKTLTEAAKIRDRQLVKLVVPAAREDETDWTEDAWKPGLGKCPVLLLKENFFEFSFATQSSPQDWHGHSGVYEIYLSESPLTVYYKGPEGQEHSTPVEGCAIIPPGIYHKIELGGPTFVFQATADGLSRIADSKTTQIG